ncbi:MAG: Lrp/AsnC family transcriptional regulator [Firmicutes bacterium]|nr:Lrp/AsnC family transcriptional regulator [Bacillota bacterium]MDD4263556.1 Lrp/AsnC family transcriptional regulator [Bacillota bacterium]MDD4692911.1 Lrp/AsnC family transcriptional regulator [Bacillota bacterium]
MDELDRKIVAILQEDGRTPYTTIADSLGVAEGTIRKRVARLMDDGILQIVGIVDPKMVAQSTIAIVGIQTEGEPVSNIVAKLSEIEEIRYIGVCAGTYDLIVEIVVGSNEELFDILTHKVRLIPGIKDSDTSLVMKVYKERYNWRGV